MEKSWCGNHETRRETPEYRTYLKTVRESYGTDEIRSLLLLCRVGKLPEVPGPRAPGLTCLESAGKSGEGREIWVMTLSDMSTGDPEDKPAIYIDGNFHAGEVTGSMINLYTIRHTLENYGNDERITKLLQRYTLYVIPRVSPDGAEMYLTTPETLRSSQAVSFS